MIACETRAGFPLRHGGSRTAWRCWLVLLGLLYGPVETAFAASSEFEPLAAHSLLLDLTRAGARIVGVGDRGHVLLSDDEGKTWQQVGTPTRAMLTGVSFGDALHGWAVGHDGVILATSDGGENWRLQESGQDLEAVLLDVHFADARHGLAVGAYGLCLVTNDGGDHWQTIDASPDGLHFNQLTAGPDGTLYLTGESGTLLASTDDGAHWTPQPVPYEGSLFGLLALGGRDLLLYGLRGHVFFSPDGGRHWSSRATSTPALIMSGLQLKAGLIVLAGLGGNVHLSRDHGTTFQHWQPEAYNGGVSALLETTDGALLVAGEKGVARLSLP